MKKLLILISIVAASMFATARAAEPTVLYERGGDGTAWSDADLEEWTTSEGTASINEGLCISWGNSGWSTTKEVNFTENSIVTLTASFTCGNTGRAGAFEYIELGGVQVRMDGQGQKGYVSFDGTNWAVDDNIILSGNPRGGSVNVTITVNQATKDASITVSGSCTGTAEGKITDNIPNKVIFGYHKNGSLSGNRTATLKSIEITEELQEVSMANYAVNYVCDGVTIKSEEGSMAVGAEVNATSPLTVDGQKYFFADGATTSMTIQGESENVLNVEMREAYVYYYTVKNNVNDDVKTGTCVEGESVTLPYNKYILKDGTVWTKAAINSEYNLTFTPNSDNFVETIEYTSTDIKDGIFFAEGEDIEGMTVVTRDNAGARCSNGAGGHAEEAVTVYTLKPGTYKLIMGVWGNSGSTFIVKAGEESILSAETKGYWLEATSEEFILKTETVLTFEGSASNKPLDYILITGVEQEPEDPVARTSWDFTKWSEATIANLNAGSNWTDVEKADGTNPTDGKCFWQLSHAADLSPNKYVKANGVSIEELKGLVYTNETNDRSLAIAINYPETSIGSYHGASYLWLGGSNINYFTIPNVPGGATIKIGIESHKSTDARGVQLKVGETILTAPDGSEVTPPTTYVEQEWFVPVTAAESNDVTITNTNGCHIYFITVTPGAEVEGITIKDQEENEVDAIELKIGGAYQLTATISPDNAVNKTVTWKSSNEEIATVDQAGKVTALTKGEAVITATSSNGKTATCTVTVKDAVIVVESITLDRIEATVAVGSELLLTASVNPTEAAVTWTSSNDEIATVDAEGNVTGVAAGEAVITAKAGEKEATCTVTVIIPVEGITLNYNEVALFEGNTCQLKATVVPDNATDKTITWTSSNEELVTVDENGNVTAVAAGEATITAKAGEKTAECKIIVKAEGTIPAEGTVLEQTFNGETTLESTEQYIWGADIQGMIKANGVYMTNGNNKAGNYENRDFLIFANPIGSSTQEVNVSYNIYNVQGKGQADTYYDINYLNADGKFVFGIREGIGNWKRPSSIVIANEDGSTTETNLTDHLQSIGKNDSGGDINITVRFSGDNALIELDGNTYTAYTNSGFQSIKLSVSGDVDYDRSIYIKNFAVKTTEVEEITTAGYTLVYKCGDEVIKEEPQTGVIDSEIIISDDKKANFFNEDQTVKYIYLSNDAEGKTIASDGTTVITLTYREAATWNYTIKNNVNDEVVEGSVLEGEKTSVAYHRYILKDGKVYIKDPGTRSPYTVEITPDKDGYEWTLNFEEYAQNAIYFVEAEDIEGVTKEFKNASQRSSYAGGGYTGEEPVAVYTLKPGTYTVEIASMGGKSGDTAVTYTVKAGEKTIIQDISNGSWHKTASAEFTVNGDTELTVQGGGSSKPFDYILITGTVKVDVEGIAITDKDGNELENLDLEAGNEYQLSAAVAPENATEKGVKWTTSNDKVATIDANGLVTAVDGGTATITATSAENDQITASITVNVTVPVSDIKLDKSEATVTMGNTLDLVATVSPDNASDKTVEWTSSDENIATVANGKVTAIKVGTATITAKAGDKSATCTVTVNPRVGDADWSGRITITDAVDITNYVVGKKTVADADLEFYLIAANANEEEGITFADASAAAELALKEPAEGTEESTQARISAFEDDSMDALVIGRASATAQGTFLPVALDNTEAYVALQADIFLPEGCNVDVKAAGRAAGSHSMLTRKHADNHIRVVFFNLANNAFAANDAPMFEILTDSYISAEDIVITNIYASDADANESVLASKIGQTSGVAAIGLDENAPIKVYDLNGIYVGDTMESLQQGTYIVCQGEAAKTVRVR